ncbi:hypothetical protein [Acrocarpospora phusangensis]|uniref:hypothetical protein n=1 Tax=Acrocarpospora phusangensis TaxID=1070424 RepID=UPI00194F165C|nr:hypothetical protein [Acrocarpospora phusangensis]
MAELLADQTASPMGSTSARGAVGCAVLFISVVTWGIALLGMMVVVWNLWFDECGLDPYTEYETAACAPLETWSSITLVAWLASPLGWLASGVFLWWSPAHFVRSRRMALWAMPAFPAGVVAIVISIYALYGPLLP